MGEKQGMEPLTELYRTVVTEMTGFREQMLKILLGIITLTVVWIGWIVTLPESTLTTIFRIVQCATAAGFYGFGILVAGGVDTYFRESAEAVRRIEEVWKAHEKGAYLPDKPILPERWKEFGEGWCDPVFAWAYQSIPIMAVAVIGTIFCR